jgi:DMSO/TMAO reductase YedYZ molybdopterin-dependent catalytic subunit
VSPSSAAPPDIVDVRPPEDVRLPPGQIRTQKWPVLHYGTVPKADLRTWSFEVRGAVGNPFTLGWVELEALPRRETVCDIHCVTRWSRYDNRFGGVPVQLLLARAQPVPTAKYALVHAEHGFTTNLPLDDLDRPANLLALTYNGEPLTAEHGGPVRLLVPHLYLWKSAKWVRGFELLEDDYPGFWEQNGYHMRGDPWQEQRYGRPDYSRMRRGPRA